MHNNLLQLNFKYGRFFFILFFVTFVPWKEGTGFTQCRLKKVPYNLQIRIQKCICLSCKGISRERFTG